MKPSALLIAALLPLTLNAGELRAFHNLKGEEIKAELISATDSRAELKRADGKAFSVPLSTLSEADRAFIAEWRKTHKHFKVDMNASVKAGNTRIDKGGAFGKDVKGNDCWYVLNFNNRAGDPLAGLRVEYVIFAPSGESRIGAADVPVIAAGKSGQMPTEKLFVPQKETVVQSGTASAVRFSESSLAGIHAELILAGKPAGAFVSGKVPADAAAQLTAWREKQAGAVPK